MRRQRGRHRRTGDQRRRVARQRPAEGRHLPHRRRRRLDDGVGIARRRALRRARRAGRQPPRRHRRQGQALSAVRRSDSRHARDARRRAADHRARRRRRRRHPPRGVQSRPAAAPVVEAGADRIVRLGRPRHDDGGDVGHDPLAGDDAGRDVDRAAHPQRQHAHARRDVECVVGAAHRRAGLAHREPEGALPAVEGGADRRQRRQPGAHVGVGRLPAAQHAPDRRQRHRAPARRRVPAAVPHRRSRAGRHRRHAGSARRRARARRRSARPSADARSRRACRPSSGRRATPTATACSTRWPTGARAIGRGRCSRTASSTTCSRGTRRRCRTAPT